MGSASAALAAAAAEAKLAAILAGKDALVFRELPRVMAALPATVKPAQVAALFERLADSTHLVAKSFAKLPAPAIRAVLAALPSATQNADIVMWRVAVPAELGDAELVAAWKRALAATLELDTSYRWGSRKRRQKIRALAEDPVVLPAIQAAVAHVDGHVPLDMLGVLVTDGSTASYDALVARIGVAFAEADRRLDLLSQLRTHAARTPALDRLFAEIDGALDHRNDTSPALALGPVIGIGECALLWFTAWTGSAESATVYSAAASLSITIDSRDAEWFRVGVSQRRPSYGHTDFSADPDDEPRDELGVGRCEPRDLPRWIANVARTLGVTWRPFTVTKTHLRGAKKERVARWLEREVHGAPR